MCLIVYVTWSIGTIVVFVFNAKLLYNLNNIKKKLKIAHVLEFFEFFFQVFIEWILFTDAVQQNAPTCNHTRKDVEKQISRWLFNARDRGGLKFRPKATPNN